jgi:oxygen-dependent protoporphyrinogen oxidase
MAPIEPLDAIIVGGGIAGLSAAWRLRHRRILLLEANGYLGGRLLSERRGEYWLNYGAHLFPGGGSVVDSLLASVSLGTVPVTGSTMGLALDGRIVSNGRVETYPFRLPLSLHERVALARAGLRLRRAVSRYRNLVKVRASETEFEASARAFAYLSSDTFAEYLGALPSKVMTIFACAAHRATAEPDELSAGCGVGLFALVWGGRGSLIARNLVGGPSRLPEALGRDLGDRVRLNAEVRDVTPNGTIVRVAYEFDGQSRQADARCVIIAVPAPRAAPLVQTTSSTAAEALGEIRYGPFVSMAIETRETRPMPWDDVYALATPGRSFDMFTNQAQILRTVRDRLPGGSLMVYAGGHRAAAMLSQTDETIRDAFLGDLYTLYPDLRQLVAHAVVHRWALGNVFSRPRVHASQPAIASALLSAKNVHIAGDYFSVIGSMESAAQSGTTAAEEVEIALTTGSRAVDSPAEEEPKSSC